MKPVLKLLFPVLLAFGAVWRLSADDAAATRIYAAGRELYNSGDYYGAAGKFDEAEFMADSGVIKSNAVIARIAALSMCGLHYAEFTAIEHLLTQYPDFADFTRMVEREYELAHWYDCGNRDPEFWYLRWIPWLKCQDHTVEMYETALKHAPYSPASASAALRVAWLKNQDGKVKEALDGYREIIRRYPDTDSARIAYLALGDALSSLSEHGDGDGRYSGEAHQVLEEFKRRYPDAPEMEYVNVTLVSTTDKEAEALFNMADYYDWRGQKRTARQYYAELLRKYPESLSAEKAERRLAALDASFVPDDFAPKGHPRREHYRTIGIPDETYPLLDLTDESRHKYLLPIYDLGTSGDKP